MLRLLVGAAILLGGLMTTIGVLAPLFPQADMTNHFRPCSFWRLQRARQGRFGGAPS